MTATSSELPSRRAEDRSAAAAHAGCPVRKLAPEDEIQGPAVELVSGAGGDRWVVRSFDVARKVLRDSDSVRQAGFGAERIERAGSKMRPPVLFLEGSQHRVQRKAAARFFAPKVTEDYREMMEVLSEELVATLRVDRAVDLSALSLRMAVQVAGRVVGLTSSSVTAMARRLDAFFAEGDPVRWYDPRWLVRQANHRTAMVRFFYLDVKPAIRARRKARREDVISQLLDQGFSDFDILTECVTYGAAGMATTREFITVATWHLLDNPALLSRYRGAERGERMQILEETLRLEPVIGHLHRRTTAPLTMSTPNGVDELAAGSLVDLDIRAINADAATVGAEPLSLCPARDLPRSVPPTLMSFGDGNHRCPGGPLALMETEVFVSTLLRRDIVAEGPPEVRWNSTTQGYDLKRYRLRLQG